MPQITEPHFSYIAFGDKQQVLYKISYLTNLVFRFDYCGLQYLDTNYSLKQIPAVQDHFRYDNTDKLSEVTEGGTQHDEEKSSFFNIYEGESRLYI